MKIELRDGKLLVRVCPRTPTRDDLCTVALHTRFDGDDGGDAVTIHLTPEEAQVVGYALCAVAREETI